MLQGESAFFCVCWGVGDLSEYVRAAHDFWVSWNQIQTGGMCLGPVPKLTPGIKTRNQCFGIKLCDLSGPLVFERCAGR